MHSRTLGMSLLPLVAWLSGDWKELTLISVLPMGLLFLGWKLVPESPRYLLTRWKIFFFFKISPPFHNNRFFLLFRYCLKLLNSRKVTTKCSTLFVFFCKNQRSRWRGRGHPPEHQPGEREGEETGGPKEQARVCLKEHEGREGIQL